MIDSVRERYGRWRLEELLLRHPGLRIVPTGDDGVVLAGDLTFRLQGPAHDPIEDTYEVKIRVPSDFPAEVPMVRETAGRIPEGFHKLEGNFLCLAAPTELRLRLNRSPTLPAFVEELVIPYLFGYSYFAKHGVMPHGELDHGSRGLLQHLAELFGTATILGVERFLLLASMRRRAANKRPCPCGSGRRLGRCHNRRVNELRNRLGRRWFRDEYVRVTDHLEYLTDSAARRKAFEKRSQRPPKRAGLILL